MVSEDLLQQLFVRKSFKNNNVGFELQLINPLSNATIIEPATIIVKGETVGRERYKDFEIETGGTQFRNQEISRNNPFEFPVNSKATLFFKRDQVLPIEKYTLTFTLLSEEFGELKFRIKERIRENS